jgi:hypothetical protein
MSTPFNYLNIATLLGIEEAALNELLWQRLADLRVAIPAVVVSFDNAKQTAKVQIAIRESALINGVPIPVDIHPLEDVIVVMPRGGGFSITMPLQAGDEGLLVFADMCIDQWYQAVGTANKQAERRRHDLSDGFFVPGGWSQPRVLPNYSASTLQIRSDDGVTHVQVGAGQITMTPDNNTTVINIVAGEIDLNATVVKINGTIFHAHVHSGVTTGGGVSGPVTP